MEYSDFDIQKLFSYTSHDPKLPILTLKDSENVGINTHCWQNYHQKEKTLRDFINIILLQP